MNLADFLKAMKFHRLTNVGKWYYFNGTVEGKEVSVKAYEYWVQILKVGGINYAQGMTETAKAWRDVLESPFKGGNNG